MIITEGYYNLWQDLHIELERKIAKFHGRDGAILYASCFDANAGLFEILLTPEDAVLSDELNHASIIDGIRLCKANKYRYKHKNMAGTSYISLHHFSTLSHRLLAHRLVRKQRGLCIKP